MFMVITRRDPGINRVKLTIDVWGNTQREPGINWVKSTFGVRRNTKKQTHINWVKSAISVRMRHKLGKIISQENRSTKGLYVMLN